MWDDEAALARLTRLTLWGVAALLLWAALVVASRMPMFDLHEIRIVGAHHVTLKQAQLVVRQRIVGNFFSVDLAAVRAAFIKLPWARDASVKRHWPDGLEVMLEEHRALARWNDDALLNRYGEVFQAATDQNLPHLSGPAGSEHEVVQAWLDYGKTLAVLKRYPVSVTLNDRRSWSLVMDNGVSIELGRDQTNWRLARWVSLYPAMAAQLSAPLVAVDLRYPKGFAVRVAGSGSDSSSHTAQKQGKSL